MTEVRSQKSESRTNSYGLKMKSRNVLNAKPETRNAQPASNNQSSIANQQSSIPGVSSEKARAILKPDTWNLCFEKASPRPIMSKKKTYFSIMLRDLKVKVFYQL